MWARKEGGDSFQVRRRMDGWPAVHGLLSKGAPCPAENAQQGKGEGMRKECLVSIGRFSLHLAEVPDVRPEVHLQVDNQTLATFAVGKPQAVWDLAAKLSKEDRLDYVYIIDILDEYLAQAQHRAKTTPWDPHL